MQFQKKQNWIRKNRVMISFCWANLAKLIRETSRILRCGCMRHDHTNKEKSESGPYASRDACALELWSKIAVVSKNGDLKEICSSYLLVVVSRNNVWWRKLCLVEMRAAHVQAICVTSSVMVIKGSSSRIDDRGVDDIVRERYWIWWKGMKRAKEERKMT